MKETAACVLGLALAAIALLGCASFPGTARPSSFEDLRREEGWLLLDTIPFVRQASERGSGAACLAMVLGHCDSGAPVESLEEECAVPGQEGIRASALRDAARRRGLAAHLFRGSVPDIERELARGRPVVVGLSRRDGGRSSTRYRVVVGLHPARGRIAALDPASGLLCDSLASFESEWRPASGVALVVFPADVEAFLVLVDEDQEGGGS